MAKSRKISRKASTKASRKVSRKGSRKASRKASRKGSRKGSRRMVSMKRRLAQVDNPCRSYSKARCGPVDPNCQWRKRAGCVRRKGAATKGLVYQGPSME